MTHFKLDFALDHTSVGDAAVLSGLQAGQRLVLRQQQQEQQRLQATQHGAEPTTVGAAAEPTSAVADGEEQHASSGPQSAASDACTESAGTSEPLANAATAVAAAAAIAPEQPQPPAPPPPAASSVLHVCDGSGQVLGIVPAAAAKRLPPRVDLAAVQVREGGQQGKHRLARPRDLTQAGALSDVVVEQRAPYRCGSGLSRSTRSMAFKRCSCVSRSPLQAVGQRQVRWMAVAEGSAVVRDFS